MIENLFIISHVFIHFLINLYEVMFYLCYILGFNNIPDHNSVTRLWSNAWKTNIVKTERT